MCWIRNLRRRPRVQESSVVLSALSVLITFSAKHTIFNKVVIFQPSLSFALSIDDSFVLSLI